MISQSVRYCMQTLETSLPTINRKHMPCVCLSLFDPLAPVWRLFGYQSLAHSYLFIFPASFIRPFTDRAALLCEPVISSSSSSSSDSSSSSESSYSDSVLLFDGRLLLLFLDAAARPRGSRFRFECAITFARGAFVIDGVVAGVAAFIMPERLGNLEFAGRDSPFAVDEDIFALSLLGVFGGRRFCGDTAGSVDCRASR